MTDEQRMDWLERNPDRIQLVGSPSGTLLQDKRNQGGKRPFYRSVRELVDAAMGDTPNATPRLPETP